VDAFHVTFTILYLAMATVRAYYKIKARSAVRIERTAEPVATLLRIVVGAPVFLATLTYVVHPQTVRWASFPLPPAWRWAGAVLFALALIGLVWIHAALGKNFSSTLVIRSDQTLVISGPYRYVRHPMYTDIFVMCIGMGLLAANWFIGIGGVLLIVLIVAFRIRREEAMMVQAFGDQYRDYAAVTGRFLPRMRTHSQEMI